MTSPLGSLRKYYWLCAIFASFFAAALILREIDSKDNPYHIFTSLLITIILESLVIWWGILTYSRITDRYIKKWIAVICVLLVFYLLLRHLKYNVFDSYTDAVRITWYMYYIPMLLIVVCCIYAVYHLNNDNTKDIQTPKSFVVLMIISIILILAVLTNDYHQLVFKFPDDGFVNSDKNYSRGILYFVISAWYLICSIIFICMVIKRSKMPGKNKFIWVPTAILALAYLYHVLYTLSIVPYFFRDMIIVNAFFTVLIFESMLQTGIIKSNLFYSYLFKQSSIPAMILDDDRNVIFSNRDGKICDDKIIDMLCEENVIVDENIRFNILHLSSGYIIWKDNISRLVSLKKKLDSSRSYLEGKYVAESNMQNTNIVRRRLRERNLLYDEMRSYTSQKVQQIRQLTEEFEKVAKEDEWKYLFLIGALSIYIKRIDNLIFIEKENGMIPPEEINNCISEIERHLKVFGILCHSSVYLTGNLTITETARLYYEIIEIIEHTESVKPSYFISLTEKKYTYGLRVRISGIDDIPKFNMDRYSVEQEDDEEFILIKSYDKESNIV